jgi:type I restriction enzyme S subunit
MSSEWREVRLGEVATTLNGAGIKQEFFADEGIPLARVSNFSSGTVDLTDCIFVDRQHAERWASHRINFGDVIVATVGSWPPNWSSVVGKVVRAPTSAVGALQNQNTCRVVARQGMTDQRFLYYLLSTQEFVLFAANAAAGSANQARLGVSSLKKFSFYLPSLDEQKEIGNFLGALDDRITMLRETNATLETIAQALFKSWFVDFDPVRAKAEGRPPEGLDVATAALFPDTFEDSELGPIPKGWIAATMADVSAVGIGKTPPRKEQHWFSVDSHDVRWVSIRDMGAVGVYANQTSEFLTSEAVEKFNVRIVPDNTVLMSFKMTIGRVAITEGEMTTNEAIAHFRLDKNSPLSSEYIYLHLKNFDFSRLSSTSSIADAVNSKAVREIQILVPSMQVAAAFQNQINTVFAKLKQNEQQIQTLTKLRDTLLPRLISGQLRLPEAEHLVKEAM